MGDDRLIKALEDKCKLQEEILEKNVKIAELEAKIFDLQTALNPKPKSARKIKRRVSFSDLDLLPDYIDHQELR